MNLLPSFPVDDVTLDCLEHALNGAWHVDADGNHRLVGADYSFTQLLDFLSGYDPAWLIETEPGIVEYRGGALYHSHDVIRALIAEVRRLRG